MPRKRRPGRPKSKRTEIKYVRVTPETAEKYRRWADEDGLALATLFGRAVDQYERRRLAAEKRARG